MNNFLTGPVRIQVRNDRNKSRDSPPCYSVLIPRLITVILVSRGRLLNIMKLISFLLLYNYHLYRMSSIKGMGFTSGQNSHKDLGPSCKTDLEL